MKIVFSYDKEFDILHVRFNDNDYKYSEELGDIVVDFDIEGKICGAEYFDYQKKLNSKIKK